MPRTDNQGSRNKAVALMGNSLVVFLEYLVCSKLVNFLAPEAKISGTLSE